MFVRNRAGYPCESLSGTVSNTTPDSPSEGEFLSSEGYRISVDDGRESFFALCIEDPDNDDAWLMSDTVRSLENLQ